MTATEQTNSTSCSDAMLPRRLTQYLTNWFWTLSIQKMQPSLSICYSTRRHSQSTLYTLLRGRRFRPEKGVVFFSSVASCCHNRSRNMLIGPVEVKVYAQFGIGCWWFVFFFWCLPFITDVCSWHMIMHYRWLNWFAKDDSRQSWPNDQNALFRSLREPGGACEPVPGGGHSNWQNTDLLSVDKQCVFEFGFRRHVTPRRHYYQVELMWRRSSSQTDRRASQVHALTDDRANHSVAQCQRNIYYICLHSTLCAQNGRPSAHTHTHTHNKKRTL